MFNVFFFGVSEERRKYISRAPFKLHSGGAECGKPAARIPLCHDFNETARFAAALAPLYCIVVSTTLRSVRWVEAWKLAKILF